MMVDVLGFAAFAVSLIGWLSYFPVSKIPSLRRSMWPVWAILLLGAMLGIATIFLAAIAPNPGFGLLGAMGALASSALFVVVFIFALLVPRKAGRPELNQPFPQIELLCQDGTRRVLRDIVPQGPVLIVFFRGFW